MTEYIEREQLIGELKDVIADYKDEHTFSTDFAATIVTDILDNIVKCQTAADVAPVVRCRDCKFGDWDSEPDDAMVCMRTKDGFWRSGNDFCSYGERKDCSSDG